MLKLICQFLSSSFKKNIQNIKYLLFKILFMQRSVIVIDDDKDTVRLFSEFLEENDIKVLGGGYDGNTAIKLYEEKKPDIILMDIMMPNGSGFHAIRKIQEIDPNAKFIVVSGDSNYLTEEKLEKLGIPLIQKPFNLKNLLSIIKA
ncbi:response regulator receiver protein [Candidatus Nitrosarchaeum limnium SFB1]|uniref:Response regulator receiver protein n=1 Tax=Candidatus Nitrosarchaeum limnium SFB1 TaxID=886738 RepID=F3KLJ7_9ARCH|nr:response regulator receiver protein [Candidatus Nitrosarchaeum limnium SFB1]